MPKTWTEKRVPDELGKIKPGVWSGLGGAIVAVFVGFNYGGWMTTGAADAMAKESVTVAVVERLGTIALAQLNRDGAKTKSSAK